MLEEIKARLSITGTALDATISGMIDDVVAYCIAAGVKYSQITQPNAIGLVARGVADLWNYGAGDGKFSQIFQMRLNQMCIDASSIDGDLLPQSKAVKITVPGDFEILPDEGYILSRVDVNVDVPYIPLQEKSITITENGPSEVVPDEGYGLSRVDIDTNVPKPETQEKTIDISTNGTETVTPDEGRLLSSVTVNTNVPSTPTQSKAVRITENGKHIITPDPGYTMREVIADVSISAAGGDYNMTALVLYPNINGAFINSISEINMADVDMGEFNNWTGMFRGISKLRTIKWGSFFDRIVMSSTINGVNMFYGCSRLETIDLSLCPDIYITNVNNMFYSCSKVKQINLGGLKIDASSLYSVFDGCTELENLDLSNMVSAHITDMNRTFYNCTSLTNIIFPDNLFPNDRLKTVDLSPCPLTHDCAVDIFNKLATRTNSPVIKLSATTKAALTEEEIAVATGKGWVVS